MPSRKTHLVGFTPRQDRAVWGKGRLLVVVALQLASEWLLRASSYWTSLVLKFHRGFWEDCWHLIGQKIWNSKKNSVSEFWSNKMPINSPLKNWCFLPERCEHRLHYSTELLKTFQKVWFFPLEMGWLEDRAGHTRESDSCKLFSR